MAPMLRQRKAAPLLPLTHSGNVPLMTQQRIKRKSWYLFTCSHYVVYIPYVLFVAVVIGAIVIFVTPSTREKGVLHLYAGHQKHATSRAGGRFHFHYSERGPRRRSASAVELELSEVEERIRDKLQLGEEIMSKDSRTIAMQDSRNEPANTVEVVGERKGPVEARAEGEIALSDQFKHKSEKLRRITCANGSTGTLNDNYCDCADGSDETETSACSHVTVQQASFQCRDKSKAIYASRVGDGVKDCPDGSDEASL